MKQVGILIGDHKKPNMYWPAEDMEDLKTAMKYLQSEERKSKFIMEGNKTIQEVNISAYVAQYLAKEAKVRLLTFSQFYESTQIFDILIPFIDPITVNSINGSREAKWLDKTFKNFKGILFPPYDLLKLFSQKGRYYRYLQERGVPVVENFTFEISAATAHPLFAQELLMKLHGLGWKGVIFKPEGGLSSGAILTSRTIPELFTKEATAEVGKFLKAFKRWSKAGYKVIAAQRFTSSFEETFEIRTYWANNKYLYSIATKSGRIEDFRTGGLMQEVAGFTKEGMDPNAMLPPALLQHLKRLGAYVISQLPSYGRPLPFLRIDFGCCTRVKDCSLSYFVNEVELNGFAWYLNDVAEKTKWVKRIAEEIAEACRAAKFEQAKPPSKEAKPPPCYDYPLLSLREKALRRGG